MYVVDSIADLSGIWLAFVVAAVPSAAMMLASAILSNFEVPPVIF